MRAVPDLWDTDPQVADHPVDRRFGDVLRMADGMATENKLALLNLAAASLGPDEVYLEIGAFRGTSIIAASLGNEDKAFVTVDNFSEFDGSRSELEKNLRLYDRSNVSIVQADVSSLLLEAQPFTGQVGVYFYDGPHRYRQHWEAFSLIESHLAAEALVIIDDSSAPQVAEANRRYTEDRSQFELLFRYHSPYNKEPRWWNGIDVFAYRRSRSQEPRRAKLQYTLGAIRYGAAYHFHHTRVMPHIRRVGSPVKQSILRRLPR
jgi:predicted O-methyltransferase YrrM